ncbi:MAG: hypothetical protein R3B70_10765 [Polyangiaceae bacterium]
MLDLAAHLGVRTGESSPGAEASQGANVPFEEWAWAFCRFERAVAVRAALTAARVALPSWEGYSPTDKLDGEVIGGPALREALNAVEAGLSGSEGGAAKLAAAAEEVRSLAARVVAYVDEASGNKHVVARRTAAVNAALSSLAAVETAVWDEAAITTAIQDEHDAAEVEEQRAAGPALHVVRALSYSCAATGMTADELRGELRRAFFEGSS